ncbi:MAG: hypothetical protein Q9188_001225 [Gyalolechia gomerana]
MSGQAIQNSGNALTRPGTNGSGGGTMAMGQQRPSDNAIGVSNGVPSGSMSQQNLNGIVSDHHFPGASSLYRFVVGHQYVNMVQPLEETLLKEFDWF